MHMETYLSWSWTRRGHWSLRSQRQYGHAHEIHRRWVGSGLWSRHFGMWSSLCDSCAHFDPDWMREKGNNSWTSLWDWSLGWFYLESNSDKTKRKRDLSKVWYRNYSQTFVGKTAALLYKNKAAIFVFTRSLGCNLNLLVQNSPVSSLHPNHLNNVEFEPKQAKELSLIIFFNVP